MCVHLCKKRVNVSSTIHKTERRLKGGWCKLISVSRLPLPRGKKFISHIFNLNTHTCTYTKTDKQKALYYSKQRKRALREKILLMLNIWGKVIYIFWEIAFPSHCTIFWIPTFKHFIGLYNWRRKIKAWNRYAPNLLWTSCRDNADVWLKGDL